MTEVQFDRDNTIGDLFDEMLADHIEKVKKNLNTFEERKKLDIRPKDLLDSFSCLWGDIDFFLAHCSIETYKKIVFEHIRKLQHEFECALRIEDDVKSMYLLNRASALLEFFVEGASWNEEEVGYRGPKIYVACCKEDRNKLYETHAHNFNAMSDRAQNILENSLKKAMGL